MALNSFRIKGLAALELVLFAWVCHPAWSMDLLSSCVCSSIQWISSERRIQHESNGPLNGHDDSRKQTGRSMPTKVNFSFSTFHLETNARHKRMSETAISGQFLFLFAIARFHMPLRSRGCDRRVLPSPICVCICILRVHLYMRSSGAGADTSMCSEPEMEWLRHR